MPRMTAKYSGALHAATALSIPIPENQEDLYWELSENNWVWDSSNKCWGEGDPPDPPTELAKVRVWAEKHRVEGYSMQIVDLLKKHGYRLAEKSRVYPCREPKQLEARVYLTFIPPEN